MKKAVKKIFYILICMIYCASLLPAAYAAGESLSEIACGITAELFTQNEPDYAITKNLTFSGLSLPEGVTASYKSSDETILKITQTDDGLTGEVYRDKYADKKVTLMVTLSDGTNTLDREIPLNVVSLATKIYYSDTFRYPGYVGNFVQEVPRLQSSTPVKSTPSMTYGVGWQSLYTTEIDDTSVNGRRFRTLLDKIDNNYCLRSERPFTAEEYNYTRYVFGDKPDGKTELSMRIMPDETQGRQIYIFHLWGKYINENGAVVRKQAVEIQLHRYANGKGYLNGTKAIGEKDESFVSVDPECGEWIKLSFVFDVETQEYDLYCNDEKLNSESLHFYTKYDESLTLVNINDFQLNSYREYGGGVLYLDDMVVRTDSHFLKKNKQLYELRDELELKSIMTDEDGSFDGSEIDSDITIDYTSTNAQNMMNTNNLSVEWSTDSEDILQIEESSIKVTQPDLDTSVTLTAKITDNNTGDFIEESFTLKVLCNEAMRDINDAYNALTAERISSQVLTALTDNLKFPSFDEVDITWESNSPCLTNDGEVTRADEDTAVTLTATISKAGTDFTAVKTFDITILAKGKKVYSADTIYYPGMEGRELSGAGLTNWKNDHTAQADRLTNTIIQDDDYNYVISTERVNANTEDYNFAVYNFRKPLPKKGEVSFRFKLLHTNKPQIYIFQLFGDTKDAAGAENKKQAVEIKIEYTGSGGCIKSAGPELVLRNGELETDKWYTMKVAFDNGKKVYDVYLDGEKLNLSPLSYFENLEDYDYSQLDFLNMKSFKYNTYRHNGSGKLYVDDVAAVGHEHIELQTVLYDDGIYRTTDTTGVITGTADVKMYLYNPTGSVVNATAVLAAYEKGKLLWAKTDAVSLPANNRATVLNYSEIDIPFSGDVEIKAFLFKDGALIPATEETVIGNSLKNMKPVTMKDNNTGNSYKVLNMFGENIMRCYYTMQCTSADGTKLYFHDADYNLYEYDMIKEEGRFLDRLLNDYAIVTSPLGNVFYINKDYEIIKMNCNTYEKSLVAKIPGEYTVGKVNMIQINNDESRISVEWEDLLIEKWDDGEKHESRFPVYDILAGEWILDVIYGFDTPWYAPNHKSINPNPEMRHLELFAHEGQHVKDRVWVMNLDTNEAYNAFVQKPYSEIEAGETAGHEGWTYDGQHIYFVNTGRRIGGYSGFAWVGYDGKNRRYINSDNSYCHVGIHPYTDRWAIGDTSYNGVNSTITLIDCYTGDSYPIATVHQTGVDPGHCHPNFSFDGKTAIFGMYDPNDVISIGWADVSKYIENAPEVYKYDLSDNCTIETAEREEKGEVIKVQENGETAYRIPAGGIMRVQYRGEELESADADITVRYLDSGSGDITIEYMVWTTTDGINSLIRHTVTLPVTGSGQWTEKTVRLGDINLENMELLEGDFLIKGGTDGACISDVSVYVK